jgi:hypothetical protein
VFKFQRTRRRSARPTVDVGSSVTVFASRKLGHQDKRQTLNAAVLDASVQATAYASKPNAAAAALSNEVVQ